MSDHINFSLTAVNSAVHCWIQLPRNSRKKHINRWGYGDDKKKNPEDSDQDEEETEWEAEQGSAKLLVEDNEEDNDGHHDDSDDLFSDNYRVKNRGKGRATGRDQESILSPQEQGSGDDTWSSEDELSL
ncbi:hypothetical protein BCON_0387g00020 [Botryotinia convoluta]|uniref:Uncharacterized protein n=1 Tax=Botryotinia convoluta TaxID=54673 RepID=A0A4Z1HKH2_9HELO|nr:hypothetical protein BCON_0387g00020 [Botryotinia convoluta]